MGAMCSNSSFLFMTRGRYRPPAADCKQCLSKGQLHSCWQVRRDHKGYISWTHQEGHTVALMLASEKGSQGIH